MFTDGEGSTRLLRQLGDAYLDLLDHHHRVLRAAWRRHDGYEFFTEGDAFGVAFASADQALAACSDAQWHLQHEPWPNGVRMPVRMGVHTGLAAPREGDYIALAVHQTSRVVAAAHGDQIVVTDEAMSAAAPSRVESTRLLGAFQLRDFQEPVRLHQLVSDGLRDSFPAIRVPPAQLHNLARPLASFIGRTDDLSRLEGLVEQGRVVSVVGPGGVGKTRLCTEFALAVVDRWSDGVWFVDLGPLDQGDLVVSATAETLSVGSTELDTLEAIQQHLSSRSTLLVFDNAEHVRHDTTKVVTSLLSRVPSIAVLVTSREPLGLRGERVMRLEPLRGEDAARLFVDRANDLHGGSGLRGVHDADHHQLLELCTRLDCLPLALEMAAARTEVLTIDEILTDLGARSSQLSSSDSSLQQRQRSLDDLVDWSVRLLDEPTRAVLIHASTFVSAFTSAALRALCAPGSAEQRIDDALYDLTRKSLVVSSSAAGERRYRLLETVRAHLRSRRSADEERSDAATLARWLVETIGPEVPRDHRWAAITAEELADLRHTSRLLVGGEPDLAVGLMTVVGSYHDLSGSISVGIDELQQFDSLLEPNTPARVRLLASLAWLLLNADRIDGATAALAEGRRLCRECVVDELSRIELDLVDAELLLRSGDPSGALSMASPLVGRDLPVLTQLQLWTMLLIARSQLGDLVGSAQAGEVAVELAERQGASALLTIALSNLADIRLTLDDLGGAARTQLAALHADEQLGVTRTLPFAMMLAALLAGQADEWTHALWLQTRADRLIDDQARTLYPEDRARADALIADAVAALGTESAASIIGEAIAAPLDSVVDRTRSVLARVAEEHRHSSPQGATP